MDFTITKKKEDEGDDLLSITKYVNVLLNADDDGVSHQELAKYAKVSEAMISKVGKRLLKVCDDGYYWLNGRRRFRLAYSPDVGFNLLISFALDSRLSYFVKSRYFRKAVLKLDFHQLISKKVRSYPNFFTPEDTKFLINIIIENIQVTPDTSWRFINTKNEHQVVPLLMEDMQKNLPTLFKNWKLPITSEDDLIRIVDLRRKLYRLIRYVVMRLIEKTQPVQFLKKRNDPNYEIYMKGYMYFANHYINRGFDALNDAIRKSCPRDVRYKPEYDEQDHLIKAYENDDDLKIL